MAAIRARRETSEVMTTIDIEPLKEVKSVG